MVSRVAPVHANDSSRHDIDETKLQFIGFLGTGPARRRTGARLERLAIVRPTLATPLTPFQKSVDSPPDVI
jgi:hypothetical protein